MAKTSELRDMSDEQLRLLLKETTEHLFRLRLQAQTERLDAPSELRKNRRLIARIQTIQRQRERAAGRRARTADVEAEISSHAQESCGRHRDQRQDAQDAAGGDCRGWSAIPATASTSAARRSARCTTRRTSRTPATWWRSSRSRPLSRTKRWRLVRVVEKGRAADVAQAGGRSTGRPNAAKPAGRDGIGGADSVAGRRRTMRSADGMSKP